MKTNTGLFLVCLMVLSSLSSAALMKSRVSLENEAVSTTVIYKIYYYGTCVNRKCTSGFYCLKGRCIRNLDGRKGSFCGLFYGIFCDSGLRCVDNLCIDKSKKALFKYIRKY